MTTWLTGKNEMIGLTLMILQYLIRRYGMVLDFVTYPFSGMKTQKVFCQLAALACCPNCLNIISVDEMCEAFGADRLVPDDYVQLSCSECTFEFSDIVQSVKGNRLNQAFIFHEDGFNAFTKKSRGIAAIHISNACSRKELRLHGKNLRVYSSIPTHLLNEGIPHRMDAFLEPLIEEITDLFLNGIQVHVPETIECSNFSVSQGNYNVRALLLLGTADLKAHQEIILYAGGIIIIASRYSRSK